VLLASRPVMRRIPANSAILGLFQLFHVEHAVSGGTEVDLRGISIRQCRLDLYAQMLRDSPHNLLSPKALLELEERHFPESIAFAEGLPPAQRLLDVGSGGGLPGVVIAIVRPEIEVHLLEATGKKARFLAEVAERVGLDVHVHEGRAEDLAKPPLAAHFDLVTARAVAPLGRLAGWCSPYLRPGGTLHAIKGERWAEELEDGRSAIEQARLNVSATPSAGEGSRPAPHPIVVVLERRA
jgi:16S rRNA (guanine527-N7)-methyltransferase